MTTFAVNLIEGLASLGITLSGLARGHYLTCDCRNSRRGQASRSIQPPFIEVQHHG